MSKKLFTNKTSKISAWLAAGAITASSLLVPLLHSPAMAADNHGTAPLANTSEQTVHPASDPDGTQGWVYQPQYSSNFEEGIPSSYERLPNNWSWRSEWRWADTNSTVENGTLRLLQDPFHPTTDFSTVPKNFNTVVLDGNSKGQHADFVTTDEHHDGEAALVQRFYDDYETATRQTVNNLSSGDYTLSAWIRSGGDNGYARLALRQCGGDDVVIDLPRQQSEWQHITRSVTVNGANCTISVESSGVVWADFLAVDQISFQKQGSGVELIRNGSFEDRHKTQYASGGIWSKERIKYGYFEVRAKSGTPMPGTCLAFWLDGREGDYATELDVVELGQNPNNPRALDFAHHIWRTPSQSRHSSEGYWGTSDFVSTEDFHIYGFEWGPSVQRWYVDGRILWERSNSVYNFNEMKIIMSLGLRSPYVNNVNNRHDDFRNAKPSEFDYVRVWKRSTETIDDRWQGDHQATFNYGNNWQVEESSLAYSGSRHYTTVADSTWQMRFEGTGIEVYAPTGENMGRVEFSLDGNVLDTVDLSANPGDRTLILRTDNLPRGKHILTARAVEASDSARVYVDGAIILNEPGVRSEGLPSQMDEQQPTATDAGMLYEGENGVFSGRGRVENRDVASGRRVAGYIGGGNGTVTLYPYSEIAGERELLLQYVKSEGNRKLTVECGNESFELNPPATGINRTARVPFRCNMQKGRNSIKFYSNGPALNVDAVILPPYVARGSGEIYAFEDNDGTISATVLSEAVADRVFEYVYQTKKDTTALVTCPDGSQQNLALPANSNVAKFTCSLNVGSKLIKVQPTAATTEAEQVTSLHLQQSYLRATGVEEPNLTVRAPEMVYAGDPIVVEITGLRPNQVVNVGGSDGITATGTSDDQGNATVSVPTPATYVGGNQFLSVIQGEGLDTLRTYRAVEIRRADSRPAENPDVSPVDSDSGVVVPEPTTNPNPQTGQSGENQGNNSGGKNLSGSQRVAGSDRIQTSLLSWQIAQDKSSMVLVEENSFVDALTATPIANLLHTGIVYTGRDTIPMSVEQTIRKHKVNKVTLVGGTQVLSNNLVAQLKTINVAVSRVAGVDRYETAVKVADKVRENYGGSKVPVVLVTGLDFADSLVAGPVTKKVSGVLLLSAGKSMPDSTYKWLNSYASKIIAVGGPAYHAISSVPVNLETTSVVGKDRFATSALVASKYFSPGAVMALASGEVAADAVVAGPWASQRDGGILLTQRSHIPVEVQAVIGKYNITIFGGSTRIDPKLVN